MIKDKITLTYILISILLVGAVTFYFAKLDISKMNSDITTGGNSVVSASEEYSKKLYQMAVSKLHLEDSKNDESVEGNETTVISAGKGIKVTKAKVLNFSTLKHPVKAEMNTSIIKPKKTAVNQVKNKRKEKPMTFSTKKETK